MGDAPNYEKHQTSTDALDTLGSIIDESEKRDAIHLAVEPAIAGETLHPGQHVNIDIVTDVASLTKIGEGVGIVDPFLTTVVQPGQHFWLVVYPRQISSLRHVWEHPSFAPSSDLAVIDPDGKPTKKAAEKWLRAYMKNNFYIDDNDNGYGTTFDTVIEQAVNGYDDYLTIIGSDAGGSIEDAFWDNIEAYTGKTVKTRASYFSCSC